MGECVSGGKVLVELGVCRERCLWDKVFVGKGVCGEVCVCVGGGWSGCKAFVKKDARGVKCL